MWDHTLDTVKCITLQDCTRFTVVKAFTDPNFATENESNLNQKQSSCEAGNESVSLEVGHWVVVDYKWRSF